jgi:maltose alpha-D-glucosyltransferase / alpha-amylase
VLTESEKFAHVPRVAGALEYRADSGQQMTFAVAHDFVPNVGDAWSYTLDELARYFERVQSRSPNADEPAPSTAADDSVNLTICSAERNGSPEGQCGSELKLQGALLELANIDPPELAQETIGGYLYSAELLGRRIGELHVALERAEGGPAFSPEPFTRLYQRSLYQSMRSQARATFDLLRNNSSRLSEGTQEIARNALEQQRCVFGRIGELMHGLMVARRIRCHGDLHLGQVLFTGKDFVIIDFEGEPERPVSERRIKSSPLRDVAGMLRSFHYAAHGALRGRAPTLFIQHASIPIESWAAYWTDWVSAAFLRGYLAEAALGGFLPKERGQLQTLLSVYLLEKALYEVRYELNNRPDWVAIPLEGILQLCSDYSRAADSDQTKTD